MFNIQGSELIFLLLVALIVLGPEKLPDAMRRFGKAYGEFKKMANGFQGELRSALDEPMRELRDTADVMMKAAQFDLDGASPTSSATSTPSSGGATPAAAAAPETAAPRDAQGRPQSNLNFGSAVQRTATPRQVGSAPAPAPQASESPSPESPSPQGSADESTGEATA